MNGVQIHFQTLKNIIDYSEVNQLSLIPKISKYAEVHFCLSNIV